MPYDVTTMQARHTCVAVFGRGLLNHLYTRLYFADDPAMAAGPILARVPEARRATLLAAREETGGSIVYRLDIVLQAALRDTVEKGWPQPLELEEHSHAAMANAYLAGSAG